MLKNTLQSTVLLAALLCSSSAAQDSIRIPNVGKVKCERIAIGNPGDYKASIARLPDDSLALTMFKGKRVGGGKVIEETLFYRSHDGGKTWSKRRVLTVLGREPYLSVSKRGTLFITAHHLRQDQRNTFGYTLSYIHRSSDAGKTWTSLRLQPKNFRPKVTALGSRNVIQLADGSLLFGISEHATPKCRSRVYRSFDDGKTWESYASHFEGVPKKYPYTLFGEAHFWQAPSGKLYTILRVGAGNTWPLRGSSDPGKNDQSERMIIYSSKDIGRTWQKGADLGVYGQMYMALLPLDNKRLLLTFTQRAIAKQLGVRAVIGHYKRDGFKFDMSPKNHIQIETKTPPGMHSGGGFGPTVRLKDNTLVTSYTYRDKAGVTHAEVVRWRIPR